MSQEQAHQFVQSVEQDATLQQKIDALDQASAALEIVKLGAERNLHFSAEEFHRALSSHLQSPSQEISEDELSSVSGGTHYVRHTPNTNAWSVHPTYWVTRGNFNPGSVIDISYNSGSTSNPPPANGQSFV